MEVLKKKQKSCVIIIRQEKKVFKEVSDHGRDDIYIGVSVANKWLNGCSNSAD